MNPQTMEYQSTSAPSYPPPQPSRPGPTPLTNTTAPALYATASGAVGAVGPVGYPSGAGYQPGGGGGGAGYYPDHNVQQQLPPRLDGKADRTIKSARSTCEFAAREYLTQLRKIGPANGSSYSVNDPMAAEAFARARSQQVLVLDELAALRRSVAVAIKEAEAHRWRKWILGGMLASIIPLVRRIFRRPSKDSKKKGEAHNSTTTVSATKTSSGSGGDSGNAIMNATEYAFAKSRSLIKRIRESVRGSGWFLGGFAAVAFFVLSVLYVFENEVSLRVAKTVAKRLKRLTAKVERGGARTSNGAAEVLDEKDLLVLQQGWRWRVLTWSS
ncbi:U6 small nuclear RNA (adenine-(43)-N(6))-methyltransferase [Apiospora arundinis]|uniref:U6 small nuclear RNA (Adenine-(43)-N(6))-methyltransferase n=1 Tax=Apiospora arundinis TaxID=335852 RepID=A0ABR2IRF4_9PEZI